MHLGLFERSISKGELTLVEPGGVQHRFGSGMPKATWIFRNAQTLPRILKNPALELGETYLNEGWDVADGSLADLLMILRNNLGDLVQRRTAVGELAALLQSWNALTASIAHVRHHYDLDAELFRTFLDRDMHYSCAYYRDPDMS